MKALSAPMITQKDEDRIVLSAIALALVGLTLIELIVTLVSRSSIPTARRVYFARENVWLFAPLGSVIIMFCAPLRARGMLAAVAALVLVVLVVLNFRGMWVWPGSFDRFQESSLRWIGPMALGAILGASLTTVPALRQTRAIHRVLGWHSLMLGLATLGAFVWGDAYVMGSSWPPTRFIPLAVSLVLILIAGAVER